MRQIPVPGRAVIGVILGWLALVDTTSLAAQQPANLFPVLAGWTQQNAIQKYNPDNLYEYINGAADLYLTYDFQELQVAEYLNSAA
jgi:hypothetical protein